MIRYELTAPNRANHFLEVTMVVEVSEQSHLELQMPAWRPGKYAMADHARSIRNWSVVGDGQECTYQKLRKDRWRVDVGDIRECRVFYDFYADIIDAGSTYIDQDIFYVNPVNCLLYIPGRENEDCSVQMPDLPEDFRVTTPMTKDPGGAFHAPDMQTLMDSPLFGGRDLGVHTWEQRGIRFHLWSLNGKLPSPEELERDLRPCIDAQVDAFGEFPVASYHFYYFLLPYAYFHGVEHAHCTTIVAGPEPALKDEYYQKLLEISSHELYHTWNVKRIRPAELMPYDLSREGYTRLGFINEGVTSYMGDHMLLRSGVMGEEDYLKKLGGMLTRHINNAGRHVRSLAESSFDTWLDGYSDETPHRKVSIYNEGALLAWLLDIRIIEGSSGKYSLDDVMKALYDRFGRVGEGFTIEDFEDILGSFGGKGVIEFFSDHFWEPVDLVEPLGETLTRIGVILVSEPSSKISEGRFGLKIKKEGEALLVSDLFPGSPADRAGLARRDRLVAIDGVATEESAKQWDYLFQKDKLTLSIVRHGELRKVELKGDGEPWFCKVELRKKKPAGKVVPSLFDAWLRNK